MVSSRAARVLPEPCGGMQLGRVRRQLVDLQPVTIGAEPGPHLCILMVGSIVRDQNRPLAGDSASPHASSTTRVASARTAFVRLADPLPCVPFAANALSGPKSLASPCDHRAQWDRPAALSPSNGSRPPLQAPCRADSKRIDSALPQKASFKSSYRKRPPRCGAATSVPPAPAI